MREKLRRKAEYKLHTFLEFYAWPVLNPATPFADNWHIHEICEHLEAVSSGQIKRLLINMPFRMLKSTIVSQAFPAWEWITRPHLHYLTASYARTVAIRDAVDCRRVIESDVYQSAWGARFKMTSDQNEKSKYQNDHQGMRTVTSTDSAGTGYGGNRLLIDDPVSALEADHEKSRLSSIEWWRGTAATRLNDPANDAIIVTHQRLHKNDLTGYILEKESGWDHLVLPMRFDPELRKTTSLGFIDPRTHKGELMFPSRLSEATVAKMEATLGAYHTNAQLQQNPDSRDGNVFPRGLWQFYKALPELEYKAMSVDCSFKDTSTSDNVAIQVWGVKGANKYLIYRSAKKMGYAATLMAIRSVQALFPDVIAILIEDKANGPAIIETTKQEIAGVLPVEPDGGKVARAYSIQPQHQAGNLYLPDPSICSEIEIYLSELSNFPNGTNDDEVDATTQVINWIRKRGNSTGLIDYYKEQAETAQPPAPKALSDVSKYFQF